MAWLFRLTDHSHTYGNRQILDNINLSIARDERIAIVGQSGVGKTTLMNILSCQQTDAIAYCPQDKRLIANLSAYNNIYMGQLDNVSPWKNLLNLIKPNAQAWADISQIADSLSLQPKLKSTVSQLSGGQQQRVAIGRAFYQQRPIFFGDEPVAGLDPVLADQVLETILARHRTCVVALHDRELALKHFDRLIGLKHGQIILDCATEQLQPTDLNSLYQ